MSETGVHGVCCTLSVVTVSGRNPQYFRNAEDADVVADLLREKEDGVEVTPVTGSARTRATTG